MAPPLVRRPRRRRAVRTLGLVVLAFVVLGPGPRGTERGADAAAADEARDVAVPVVTGGPIRVDGKLAPAEWSGAAVRTFDGGRATLRLAEEEGTLFLGVTGPGPWARGASLWLVFRSDGSAGHGLYEDGALRLDYEPREHNRPHLLALATESGGERALSGVAVARSTPDAVASGVEVAVRLAALGVDAERKPDLRFALVWMQGRERGRATWPEGLDLSGPAGRPPPGLAGDGAWARLSGWKDARGEEAGGPEGLATPTWEALANEDAEIARRGSAAHAEAMAITESGRVEKKDEEVDAAVAENFRWIAEREPLTPTDVLALAEADRFLNRRAAALAELDALSVDPAWNGSFRLVYERARTLDMDGRFEEAAHAWSRLAALAPGDLGPQYATMATRAEERAKAWAVEAARRAEDARRADLPVVRLRTTRGDVLVQVFTDDVPKGAGLFLDLVRQREGDRGFYDGTRFHRVESEYLVQGGDPVSREDCSAAGRSAGPLTAPVERNERHGFWRGALGFARQAALVNGCQFFVLVGARPELDDQDFTCFGQVLSGLDVIDRLEVCDELIEATVLAPEAWHATTGGGGR